MNRAIILLLAGRLLFSCHEKKAGGDAVAVQIPAVRLNISNALLRVVNGVQYLGDSLFSGTIESFFPSGTPETSRSFYQGRQEGWSVTYYPNGNRADLRYYHLGEKDSVHTGWWENGQLRFRYHFSHGNYDGLSNEWYRSGKLLKEIVYVNGNDVSGKGWRENGKPFMNFIMRNGRRYGLMNGQLCYSLKNEKGLYRPSPADTSGNKRPG
jgi:hypothetical protein